MGLVVGLVWVSPCTLAAVSDEYGERAGWMSDEPPALNNHRQSAFPDDTSSVTTAVTYMGELWGNGVGGRKRGWVYLDNVDVEITYSPRFWGWRGSRFEVYFLGNQGGSISTLAGDGQGISDIEAVNSWRLFEGLFFQRIKALNTSLMAGKYDLNAEFDLTHTGSFFINSSHGIGAGFGQSGVAGPSTFPHTGLSFRVRTRLSPRTVIKSAVTDGEPAREGRLRGTNFRLDEEKLLLSSEFSFYGDDPESSRTDLLSRSVEVRRGFKIAVGGWLYTAEREGFQTRQGTRADRYHEKGIYALANIPVFEDGIRDRRVSGFARLGINSGKINRFAYYIGGGMVFDGYIPGRKKDKTGWAVATAVNSSAYRSHQRIRNIETDASEVNVEFSHQFHLVDRVRLQLDLQYVHNPNTIADRPDALLAGVRLILDVADF